MDNIEKLYAEKIAEKVKILKSLSPLQKEEAALAEKIAPLEAELRATREKIAAIEKGSGLAEISRLIAALAPKAKRLKAEPGGIGVKAS